MSENQQNIDQLYGTCLILNARDSVKEMAGKGMKITRYSLAKYICQKYDISLKNHQMYSLKRRLLVPLKAMQINKEISIAYETNERKTNTTVYTIIIS